MYNLSVGRTVHPWGTGHLCSPYQHKLQGDRVLIVKTCKIYGCNIKHRGLGYCNKHYQKFKKYGNPLYSKSKRIKEKHGMYNTFEYKVWHAMIQRSTNINHKQYSNYGGRGITVCKKWLNSFTAFYNDMGKKPFPKAQIDRIDNDKGYYKDNCRWVSNTENQHNKRNNVVNWFTVKSLRRINATKKYTHKQLSKIYNLKMGTVRGIVYNQRWKEETK